MAEYRIGDEEDIAGELIGDDDEVSAEEIGRRVARALRKRGTGLMRSRDTGVRTPYGQPVQARHAEVRADLYQVFGLGSVTVAAPGGALLQQNFIERFTPGRLLLTETTPGANILQQILIGIRPQTANIGSVPVAAFGAGAFETRVHFDTGEVGQPFSLNIVTGAAAQTIAGCAFGTTIKSLG